MYRILRKNDPSVDRLLAKAPELLEAVERKSGLKVSLVKGLHTVLDALVNPTDSVAVIRVGHCWCLCSVTSSWYSNDLYLYEELLIADGTGDFRIVLDDLRQYARDKGCVAIVVGTLAQAREEAYGKLLSRYGYKKVASTYMKEL